ncbi:MAG: hypothetical protein JNJ46_23275 [Myxococcales bacterium]|nr:hypothetical protein [Myxococcales bacterium]
MPTDQAAGLQDMATPDLMPAPPPTEFYVVRVGDGAVALSSAATALSLERRKLADGSMVGAALALPTSGSGAQRAITLGGSSISEGSLSRSADGRYLLLAGYDAAPGTAAVASTSSATVNRVIARVDASGGVDTSTAADFFSGNAIRSATSTDGRSLWAAGAGGIVYAVFGSTAKPASLLATNMRWLQVASAQLYASSASGSNQGISRVGNGTPTGTATATLLAGFSAQANTSHYGFFAADRDGQPGLDVIYVADDRSVATGGGVQRWKLSGTTWVLEGTMSKNLTAGVRGLAGYAHPSGVTLVVTTAESPARVVRFEDDGTALDMIAAQPLATASANTAYRGVAWAPWP